MNILSRLFGGGGGSVEEIDVAGTADAQRNGDVQIVDCRSEREWKSGHIKGSILMPLGSVGGHLHELNPDQSVIVVCRSGHRSSMAARKLSGAGFSDVKSMRGGINAWTRSGKQLIT